MKKLGYRWVRKHKGLYFDGHEQEDVVNYRQNTFLPTWYKYASRICQWTKDDINIEEPLKFSDGVRPAVGWFHDETIFYANDHRLSHWVKEDESPQPQPKGEGPINNGH